MSLSISAVGIAVGFVILLHVAAIFYILFK